MNNSSHKAKKASVTLLAALIIVSTSFASVMTGCGSKNESSSTAATVSATTTATVTTTATATSNASSTTGNQKTESEQSSQSSNAESSKAQSSQTSEKSESEVSAESSKAESKAETSKSEASSKTSDNSSSKSDNNSGEILSIDGHDYKKGDTATVTYSVKSTKVLANFQATISYDSSKLKVKKAELQKPAAVNSIINAKNAGVIKFNGSDISTGYDYTNGGDFFVVTYEVTGTGSASTSFLWESASTIENNKIITHIDENGKSDGTVTLSTSYK